MLEGLKSDEATFGEIYLDADTGQYIVSVYANIKDKSNKVIGVVSVDVPLDSIVEIMQKADILKGSKIYGVDVAGEIQTLATTCSDSVLKISETTENIKNLVDIVLDKAKQSNAAVIAGSEAVEQTDEIFKDIQKNVKQIQEVMVTVSGAFQKVEHTASDMAANTEEQTASTWITSFHGLREYKSFGLRS